MKFPGVRLTGCFPELFGFVLVDPARLELALGSAVRGTDLLERFTTTDHGDRITHDGIVIPLMGVDAGDYTVLVRHVTEPSPWPAPRLSSPGWVLGTDTGALLFCGAGYLTDWQPAHPRHRHLVVPPGWYDVEIRGHVLTSGPDDAAYEFVLTPADARPAFRAHLDRQFRLIGDR